MKNLTVIMTLDQVIELLDGIRQNKKHEPAMSGTVKISLCEDPILGLIIDTAKPVEHFSGYSECNSMDINLKP